MKYILVLINLLFTGFLNHSFAQFEVNNDAADLGGGYFRLTQAINSQAGSVWYKLQHNLNDPLNIEGQMYFGNDNAGADGMAFVLQNNCLAAGSTGGGIGYANMPGSSIAVEFDTYENIDGSGDQNNNDPPYDHIAILKSGNVDHLHADNLYGPVQIHNTQSDVEDNEWYDFRINYDPSTQNLSVYFDNSLRVTYNYDILNTIFGGDPYVYWGFTASTGGFNNEQQIYINATTTTFALSDSTICSGSVNINLPPLTKYMGENLALGKTAVSSSDEAPGTHAMNVLDGNSSSRWASQFSDPQWIYIDLGAATDIDSVILNWEGAYGTEYFIQTSSDAIGWTDVYHETAGDGGIDKIYFSATDIRYVRMYGVTRATVYGYSLWEFEVYGSPNYVWSPDDGSIDNIYGESPTFTPTTTTTYTVLIPDPCNGPTPYNMTITIDCTPMPVEFIDFNVYRDGSTAQLKWTTGSENNSGYFEVQRSSDGIHFTTIGWVNAAGNSSQAIHYSYEDSDPLEGISYYKILETDLDGSVYQSIIRSLTKNEEALSIAINHQTIRISSALDSEETIYYKLITLNGQTISKGAIHSEKGHKEHTIETPVLAASYYIIHVYTDTEYIIEKILLN